MNENKYKPTWKFSNRIYDKENKNSNSGPVDISSNDQQNENDKAENLGQDTQTDLVIKGTFKKNTTEESTVKSLEVPIIKPIGSGVFDVVNDFPWHTKYKQRLPMGLNVPSIRLVEKRLSINTLYSQLFYQFNTFVDSTLSFGSRAGKTGEELFEMAGSKSMASFAEGWAEKSLKSEIKYSKMLNISVDDGLKNELLPYSNLYMADTTGFQYILPYNVDFAYGSKSKFSDKDSSSSGVFADFLTGVSDGMKEFSQFSFVPNEFRYIENSKHFDFSSGDIENFTIKFPLFNNIDEELTLKNWQLMFLLSYQTSPARLTKALVEPPCIYELTIPGIKYYPFAYISSVKVTMEGTRVNTSLAGAYRNVDNNDVSVNTVIPEVYIVEIDVTALTQQTTNFMYSPIAGERNKINTDPRKV